VETDTGGSLRQTPKTPGYLGCVLFTQVVDALTGQGTRVSFHALRREQEANTDKDKYALLRGRTVPPTDTTAGDWRILMSVGPFPTLMPGQTVSLAGALMCAASHDDLLKTAATAALTYEGRWVNADHNGATGINGKEYCFTPGPQAVLVDDDCDPATRRVAIGGTVCRPEN